MNPTSQNTGPAHIIRQQVGSVESVAVPQQADGEVVWAGQGRRIREARAAVAACFEESGTVSGVLPEHLS